MRFLFFSNFENCPNNIITFFRAAPLHDSLHHDRYQNTTIFVKGRNEGNTTDCKETVESIAPQTENIEEAGEEFTITIHLEPSSSNNSIIFHFLAEPTDGSSEEYFDLDSTQENYGINETAFLKRDEPSDILMLLFGNLRRDGNDSVVIDFLLSGGNTANSTSGNTPQLTIASKPCESENHDTSSSNDPEIKDGGNDANMTVPTGTTENGPTIRDHEKRDIFPYKDSITDTLVSREYEESGENSTFKEPFMLLASSSGNSNKKLRCSKSKNCRKDYHHKHSAKRK